MTDAMPDSPMPDLHLRGDPAAIPDGMDPSDQLDSMEARVILKAIDLPETGALTEPQRQNVLRLVQDHLKRNRLPYSALAVQLGVGESTVSEVLRRRYRGDVDAVLRRMNSWVEDDERRRRSRAAPIGHYETSVLLAIRDAANIAKRNARDCGTKDGRSIVMAYGPAGCGKSLGASALAALDPNAILIRIRADRGSGPGIAMLMSEAEGWRGRKTRQAHTDWIFERLKNSNRLLIVDEAHRIAPSGYVFLRDLADVCGIPILLLGTEEMASKVTARRVGVGRGFDEQFSSRVFYLVDLLRGSDGKGGSKRPFFTTEEVAAIFRRDRIRLTTDGVQFLQGVACCREIGMLRMAANIYAVALPRAIKEGGRMDAAMLTKAARKGLVPPGVDFDVILKLIHGQIDRNTKLESAAGREAAAG